MKKNISGSHTRRSAFIYFRLRNSEFLYTEYDSYIDDNVYIVIVDGEQKATE